MLEHRFSLHAVVACAAVVLPGAFIGKAAAAAEPAIQMPGKAFTTGSVEAGGFRIQYAEAGPRNAPVIVSLPGSAGLEMSRAKDELAKRFRVIELQPPGWGNSPELTRDMEQSEIGKILGEAANKLVNGRYHVIGTSMGGGNALHLVATYPDRVKSVTLEGGMAPSRLSDLGIPMIYRDEVKKMMAARGAGGGQRQGGGGGNYPAAPVNPDKPWATADYNANQMNMRFRMMQFVQTDQGTPALFAKVNASKVPVLGLLGDKDGILKPSTGDYQKEVLPGSRFVLIPGAGHDIQNTRTADFVREVTAFVTANDRD